MIFSPDILRSFSCDYAELRWERKKTGICHFQGKELEELSTQESEGGAARVLFHGFFGFCSFSRKAQAKKALEKARDLARAAGSGNSRLKQPKAVKDSWIAEVELDPFTVPWEEKIAILKKYNQILRSRKGITTSQVRYREMVWEKELVTSLGTEIYQKKWDVGLRLAAIAREGSNVQIATYDDGSMKGFSIVQNLEEKARQIAAFACDLLRAKPCPSGVMPVICDPEVTGLLAHEAFGHLSEADFAENNPRLKKLMAVGKRFGPPILSIVDDGALPMLQGTWKYDDEGVPTGKTVMLDRGVFRHRLHNMETAFRFRQKMTGNARAISFQHPPIVRMTNTYIKPHKATFEELCEGIQDGLYVCGDRGGQTNCEMFTFTPAYGYRIQKGKVKELIRDVTLTGNVFSTLSEVDLIGSDFKMIGGLGGCGKNGQSPLPVTLGGPHMRIRKVTVGGQS